MEFERPLTEFENQVLLGNCLVRLREIPDNTYDSCVTDVPYGLGNHEPTVEEIVAYLMGANLDTGGDFMGKDWEIPSVLVWREVYRVLKPGAHVLCFGGTRTWDLISLGARAAGFEYRDTIADEFPALQWVQGQGFPKSLNISKAIDRELGSDREVVGRVGNPEPQVIDRTALDYGGSTGKGKNGLKDGWEITKAGSDEAAKWDGWGTALKPSWEPILVFRKPVEGTVAGNVLTYGTGGMNIDATRVKHASKEDFDKHKAMVDRLKEQGGQLGNSWKNSSDLSGANEVKEGGRWPTNVLMSHAEGCVKASPEGTEDPEAWQCVEGCPIRAMDEQSGDQTGCGSSGPRPNTYERTDEQSTSFQPSQGTLYSDKGGASRFFPQFAPDGRWPANVVMTHGEGCRQVGTQKVKAPVINRFDTGMKPFGEGAGHPYTQTQTGDENGEELVPVWECAEGCPVKELDQQSGITTSGAMKREVEAYEGESTTGFLRGRSGPSNQHGDTGGASRFFPQFEGQEKVSVPFFYTGKASKKETTLDGLIDNKHPTKKPVALMRWLVRLVTPKGGITLDPYCGSGSTLHAAIEEDVRFTGIELDEESYKVASQRVAAVLVVATAKRRVEASFDAMMELPDD
jgi:DNA modification methylase